MSLDTYSRFYYGYEIDESNQYLNFDEGGGELTALIEVGSYSLTDLLVAVESALNIAGAFTYTVTVNRTTRIVTLGSSSAVDWLFSTGAQSGISAHSLLGFPTSDILATTSAVGTSPCGSAYSPQYILQDHVATGNYRKAAFATVNKAASGKVQVQKFGTEKFMQASIRFSTNIPQPSGGPILTNPSGVEDLQAFMQHLITKAPVEFMPDASVPGTFETFILESSDEGQDGIGYKLKELYDKGIPGYFDTGILKFRLIED